MASLDPFPYLIGRDVYLASWRSCGSQFRRRPIDVVFVGKAALRFDDWFSAPLCCSKHLRSYPALVTLASQLQL